MKKFVAILLSVLMVCVSLSALAEGQKVGVSMPTKDLQRWNQDGANMEAQLKAAGYEVDLQYASNDVQQQLNQVTNMINNGCQVIVIAAIEGSSLGSALDLAKEKGIPVIAYDRLLMESDAVSYYATFDNYKVGQVQGNYVKEALDLDNAEGPFYMEITAGDPGDNNANFFYSGAMDVLKPYIDAGQIIVKSGQTVFSDVATPTWKTEVAQTRALAAQVVKMVGQIMAGETVDVNDTETYNNNKIVVPSFLCDPVFASVENYEALLVESGYYTADQLK